MAHSSLFLGFLGKHLPCSLCQYPPWISADAQSLLHPASPSICPAKNPALQLPSPAWPASATGTRSKWPLNSISVLQHLIMIGWALVPQTAEAHYQPVSRPVSQLIGSPQSQTADDQRTGLQLLQSPCFIPVLWATETYYLHGLSFI